MTKLLPIILIAMCFAMLSEMRSQKNLSGNGYRRKDAFFCVCMMLVLAVFVGLRTRYNDTTTYTHSYELLRVKDSLFNGIKWSLSSSVGFELTQRLIKYLGGSAQTFLMLFALFDVGVNVWFIRKYSDSLWLSFFLYIAMGCYVFNMAAIMQCTATSLILIAMDRLMEGKKRRFVLYVILAALFHTYAIMFILAQFLFFTPWKRKTNFMLVGFMLIGLLLPRLLGLVVALTSAMGESYSMESFAGAGVNLFRFLVVSAPIALSFLVRDEIKKQSTRNDMLIFNLSMLNAEIMFVALFGTANYFARLANYFLIFQTLTLPWLLRFFRPPTRRMLTVCIVVCYVLYFYYQSAIVLPFDYFFDRVDLIDYIKTLLP